MAELTSSSSASIHTATLLGRLRGTPGLWLFAVLALLAPVTLWLELRVVRAEATAPDLGFDIQRSSQHEARIAFADERRWPGVKSGDALLAINAAPIDARDFWWHRTGVLQPGPIEVTFARDGAPFTLRGQTAPPQVSIAVAYAMRLVTGALLLLIALGAFLMRPGGAVSWLFLLFVYSVAEVTMITAGFLPNALVLYFTVYLLLAVAPLFGLLLFTVFPKRLEVPRAAYATLIGLTVVMVLSHPVRLLVFPDLSGFATELVTRAWAGVCCVVLVIGQVVQAKKATRAGDGRLAAQYRTLVVASFLGLLAPVVLSTVARALRLDGSLAMELSATLVLTFALLMGWVLVRHNPLAIDRYATSVVGYVVTVGGLGVVLAIGLVGVPLLISRLGLTQSSEALVVVTAAVSVSVGPVYRRLRKRVDRFFSEEQADVMQTAEVLRRVVDAVQHKPQHQALTAIVEAARVLGAEHAALWQLDPTGKGLQRAFVLGGKVDDVPRLAREQQTAELLERAGGVAGLTPTLASEAAQQVLWSLNLVFAVPVRAHGVAVGFLGVGRRPSGFAFRAEDESFLGALASQAGLALERGDHITNIGRYRVERRLAAGGMAEIFVAWQLGPGGFERKVALKRLLPELAEDPRHAASLLDEAAVSARLSHRSIAQVFEVGLEGGQHFIAMEFVDGPPLRALLAAARKQQHDLPLSVWLTLANALLGALQHAHTVTDASGKPLGVVHRDVTPANVLLTKQGEVKLVDFGLVLANARLFRTQTGVARGTLPYMSPEQAAGDASVNLRTDLYSAAATLYEALTLARAFPEGPYGPRPSPASTVRPGLPVALDAVLERAMSLSVEARHASAQELFDALAAAAAVPVASEAELGVWVDALAKDVGDAPAPKRTPGAHEATASLERETIPHAEKP